MGALPRPSIEVRREPGAGTSGARAGGRPHRCRVAGAPAAGGHPGVAGRAGSRGARGRRGRGGGGAVERGDGGEVRRLPPQAGSHDRPIGEGRGAPHPGRLPLHRSARAVDGSGVEARFGPARHARTGGPHSRRHPGRRRVARGLCQAVGRSSGPRRLRRPGAPSAGGGRRPGAERRPGRALSRVAASGARRGGNPGPAADRRHPPARARVLRQGFRDWRRRATRRRRS